MKIGILLPSILTSKKYLRKRIFAPHYFVNDLSNAIVKKGHKVFLYTSKDVNTKAHVIGGDTYLTNTAPLYYQMRNREKKDRDITTTEIIKRDFEYHLTMKAYKAALDGKLDIIHAHDFGAHYFNEVTNFPTVYTLHDPLPIPKNTIEYRRLSKFKHHNYVSISNAQRKGCLKLNFVKTIY